MNSLNLDFANHSLHATGDGALFWPEHALLVVSDLHLGKSNRVARRSGQMLPPYDTRDTIDRLARVLITHAPKMVICLGDSFDDVEAGNTLSEENANAIRRLVDTHDWVWIEGNHDPVRPRFSGTHCAYLWVDGITFRHVASCQSKNPEISGHYHPKTRIKLGGRTVVRPSFLLDHKRLIMPSFGTYTGGLFSDAPALKALMAPHAKAILTGPTPHLVPLPT